MIVSILSVVLMMVDHRQNHLEGIRSFFSTFIYPVQVVVDAPTSAGHWVGDVLSSRETLLEENTRLKREQTLLKVQIQKLSSLIVENNRLRDLLQSSRKVGQNVLIGELLAVDLEPFTRQIVLNKGSNDEVFIGQPLLDADGIMGQIIHVGPFSSTAMMITDPNHAIPVHVNRNGQRAILVGTGKPDVLEVPFLANSADITEGDLLISSGLGGRFPPDYPVARVTKVVKDPAKPYAVITATPTAKLERSREVLLVWQTQEGAPMASAPLEISPQTLLQAEKEVQKREQLLLQMERDQAEGAQLTEQEGSVKPDAQKAQPATRIKAPDTSPRKNTAAVTKPVAKKPAISKPTVATPVVSKPVVIPPAKIESDDRPPVQPVIKKPDTSSLMPIQEEFVAPSGPDDSSHSDLGAENSDSKPTDEGQ